MPLDPGPSRYAFDIGRADAGEDLVGAGADLEPATILAAYRAGAFPMGLGRHGAGPMGWWSPDPRGVLRPEDLRVSRSLRRSCARLQVTVDTAFDAVVRGCADPDREGRWITRPVTRAYTRLHALGWAHSVEVWSGDQLVGGLYGIAIGGLFAGESMFHRVTDASKVALVALRELITADGDPRRIIDVQWVTPHLASLGVREVPRAAYLGLLRETLEAPLPAPWR
ncbi:MAG TPA: leucyl/phenylalanyl-tRNA--protein transferase [Dermatophilaceae bacterium]|jgi:leucyl/phenylalanyl-tRNA--protein transferase|nr:MAG: Leucyl/phenylalanyl-tRNA--protein transferase [bacterium ADurb.BinA028]HOA01806.1 leucyl/phenylalanyl-tRNA--protein transferase [Dermatophilaceae bacterium]HOV00990.1 leucyl/phenylalanyl-tRNA--protein transferase [Dermatophilaceae bacterium]HQG11415.1 leucyl/phenylalanyl-tRNA--protein transferase [Dermatophilaceae bacterium]HQH89537.1 leucyl/phenylalanyl-tRNA--protein transferase [Dermatophilaceae bacterium]